MGDETKNIRITQNHRKHLDSPLVKEYYPY